MKAWVLGLGKAGSGVAKLLHAQGHAVSIWDEQDSPPLQIQRQDLAPLGIPIHLGSPFKFSSDLPDHIIVSPGIRWDHPFLAQARQQGIPVVGEAEWSWGSLSHLPWVSVTGTNGKTTTTALVAALWAAAGRVAPACGNIGYAIGDFASEVYEGRIPADAVIAELSSYQLEASQNLGSNGIGIWTTLTPDHLERHGTLERYAQIKASLLDRCQQRILNGDDPYLYTLRHHWPNTLWTSTQDPQAPIRIASGLLWVHDQPIADPGPLKTRMPGDHNLQNLLMATAAAVCAQLDLGVVQQVIDTFPGIPHRLERVRDLHGIHFINDSKATNYDAAWVGLNAVDPPVILIAGGQPKQGDDQAWLDLIHQKAAHVILFGAAAPLFAEKLQGIPYPHYEQVSTLDLAVTQAWHHAQVLQRIHPQVTVLFSPACASFDQYPNFERRGDHFRTCCQDLEES